MEKGIVESYDKSCGTGLISWTGNQNVRFFADSIIGKERADIKQGDSVLFEVDDIKNLHIATNIRKM